MSLELRDVSVVIDGNDVLRDVSLEVGEREVVAVLGPSGSGKTTILRVVAGLQPPTRGRVLIGGEDVTAVPTHRRGVGLMFQDHALFPHRDVAGNVAFGLRMARVERAGIAPRVDEVLDLVGLAGYGRRTIDGLSGGERQRVALARALAPRPRVLLLDEPLGSLDRALRDRLLDDLAEVLRHSGATVVHVTHDRGEAFATGERVVVVRDGEIAQVASPQELWHRPIDSGVARIVGPAGLVRVRAEPGGTFVAPWGRLDGVSALEQVPGRESVLVVRPDDVEVVADSGAGSAAAGSFAGRVVARAFRGDQVLLRIAIATDSGELELPVVEGAAASAATGEQVVVRLLPGRGVVVPDS
jgi:thiamine transport system ATP-binding protein